TNSSGRLEAKEAEACIPTVWLWRLFAGPKSMPFLRGNSWTWTTVTNAQTNSTNYPCTTFQDIKSIASALESWVPQAELLDGAINTGGKPIRIPRAVWSNGTLSATAALPSVQLPLMLAAANGANGSLHVEINAGDNRFSSAVLLSEESGG